MPSALQVQHYPKGIIFVLGVLQLHLSTESYVQSLRLNHFYQLETMVLQTLLGTTSTNFATST